MALVGIIIPAFVLYAIIMQNNIGMLMLREMRLFKFIK